MKKKVKDGDEITIDPMEVTKQMLLTCKVMRRRNNNVIPITQIRNNAIKVRENEGISRFLGFLKANRSHALLKMKEASTFRTLEWNLSASKSDLIIANRITPPGLPHKVTVLPLT